MNTPIPINKTLILKLISFIDLTTLNNTDTIADVDILINKANQGFENVHPAAVCTFSTFSNELNKKLAPQIKSAVVGGCFPTGQTLSSAKIEEVRQIALTGVDEIDVVLNRGDFFQGEYDKIHTEIAGMKAATGKSHLKVILETGDLKTEENIKKASEIAIKAGADFIKTSTGKTSVGATPAAVTAMCKVIKSTYQKNGKMIGIKPSGGIRTLEDALIYYQIVSEILGEKWLKNNYFRIGASALFDRLINAYKNC